MPQVHHMVLLKFKQDVNDTAIAEVLQIVEELKRSIPGIDYCSSGAYSSPEGFNKGFTVVLQKLSEDRKPLWQELELCNHPKDLMDEDKSLFDSSSGNANNLSFPHHV
jgi:Stress responsive A/B Barrel Domain